MDEKWQTRQILIWGKTRPELSKKYREIVCTGGVFADTKRLVRIYPVPLRYLDDEHIFKKYQWIEASVTKSLSDPRPESYRIRYDGIRVLGTIPTKAGNWDARSEWIIHEGNTFQSVEALQEQQSQDFTSLGLVRPRQVKDIASERFRPTERTEFWTRYKQAISQMEFPLDPLTGHEVKPLKPLDYRFKIRFRCDDERCQRDHIFSVLDWEIDALYSTMRQRGNSPNAAAKAVMDKLAKVCAPDKDLYLFLGNIATHPHIFTIVGFWYPKKKKDVFQPTLF